MHVVGAGDLGQGLASLSAGQRLSLLMWGELGLWCVNQAVDVRRSLGTFSGDALRHRHPEPSHPVEHRAADPGFSFLSRHSPGAQATTDDGLVAGYGGFPEGAPAVADRLFPAQAPLVPDHLDVLVALTGRGPGSRAQRCGGPWRDDHRHGWVGLTLSHGAVDGLAVIGPVGRHRRKPGLSLARAYVPIFVMSC